MARRPLIPLVALALVAVACSDVPHATFEAPEGMFTPLVADSTDNVGLGNDIAVDPEGIPYVSYFGFEAEVEEGEIAAARPVGAPFLPAVQVASLAEDGAWTQGAVAQAQEFTNVPVPFGPTFVESLKNLDPDNANGTSIAVAESGSRHVAFTSNNGVWHAESTAEGSTTEQVYRLGTTLNVAGPIGRPGVAVDGATPWVAWSQNIGGRQEVRVATPRGEGWRVETIAERPCDDCGAATATEIGISPAGPVVVFQDQVAGSVVAARQEGGSWALDTVDGGAAGLGLSLDVDAQGVARVAYYAGDGAVRMAQSDGGAWSTAEVGPSGELPDDDGTVATTGIAVSSEGVVHVAWYSAEDDSVRLARQRDGGFERIETIGTQGGQAPSLAAGPEGRVYLAWYDVTTEDLLVGVIGGLGELLVAQPSPPAEVQPPAAPADCGEDGEIVLETSAVTQAAFENPCLVAPAGEPFELTFDNQDLVAHNLAVYVEEGGEEIDSTALEPGPQVQTLPLDPLDPGDYFFNCQAHPATMTGSLVVVG